jgi:hypothetical protein
MGAMASVPGRLVYRPATGRLIVVVYLVFALWWGSAAVTGPGLSWTAAAWLASGSVVLYALFWRPAVIVEPDGVRLVNIVREVRVPWAALQEIETRYALTLVAGQRSYASWAASAPGRRRTAGLLAGQGRGRGSQVSAEPPAPRRPGWTAEGQVPDRSSRDLHSDSGAAAFMIEQAWTGWRHGPQGTAVPTAGQEPTGGGAPPGRQVAVRWNYPLAAVLVAVPAAAVLAASLHA